MMDAVRQWVLGLCGAAALCALALTLCPEGRVRKVLRCVCGAVMALQLLYPITGFDMDFYSSSAALYRQRAAEAAGSATAEADRLSRTIIEDECAAYILDKADELSCPLTGAEVSAVWSTDGYWYPWEATLRGGQGEGKAALARLIEAELGVPAERQHWEEG